VARGVPDEATYQPQVMPEDLPRKIVPRANETFATGAFENAVTSIDKKYQQDSATWAGDQIAKARTAALQSLQQAQDTAPAGDQTGFTQKYLTQFDKDNEKLVSSAGSNPVAASMVQKGLGDLRDALSQHSLQWEAQQNVANRVNTLQDYVKTQSAVIEAHPEMHESVGSTAMTMLNASGMEPSKRLPIARQIDAAFSEAAANGLVKQNPQGMYNAIKDPENAPDQFKHVLDGLNDQQRERVLQRSQGALSAGVSNAVIATYRNEGPIMGAKALGAVDKTDQPPEIKAQIYADVEKGLSQWHAEARQTHANEIMGLEERLAAGKTNPNDTGVALDLFHKGVFTAEQTGEIRGRIEKAQEKQVGDQSNLIAATQAYNAGQGLDPKDKDARAGVRALFDTLTTNVQPGSPEWINRAADIAQKTGITPDSVIEWSRTALVSSQPAVAAQAAQAIQRQQDANPRGIGYAIDPETKAMAKMVNDAVHAGSDQTAAVENARKVAAMPDADKQRLDELYKQQKIAQAAPGALNTELKADPRFASGWFHKALPVPPAMVGEFEELRQNYFKLTNGNVQQTNDLAFGDLKNTWGITKVNGKPEYMQFAPETMNPGLTTEYLRKDMEESIKGHTDEPTKVRLVPTADTFQSGGQRWGLGIPDKFGAYSVVTDKRGNPLPYQIPTAQASYQDTKAKANKEGMDRLHDIQQAAAASQKDEWQAIEDQQKQRFNSGSW
jgi:hypothetical protein